MVTLFCLCVAAARAEEKQLASPDGKLTVYLALSTVIQNRMRTHLKTMAWGYGLKAENTKEGGIYVTRVDDQDTLRVCGVDFGKKGAKQFIASVASDKGNCAIEVHLDNECIILKDLCYVMDLMGNIDNECRYFHILIYITAKKS